jgi:hypothetical protein
MRTVSLIEAVFLLVVTPGWLYSVRGTVRALEDWRLMKLQRRNGGRLLVARMMVYVYLSALAGFTLLTALGVQLATAPNPSNPERGAVVTLLAALYIGLALIKTAATVRAQSLKDRLTDYMEYEGERREHGRRDV